MSCQEIAELEELAAKEDANAQFRQRRLIMSAIHSYRRGWGNLLALSGLHEGLDKSFEKGVPPSCLEGLLELSVENIPLQDITGGESK